MFEIRGGVSKKPNGPMGQAEHMESDQTLGLLAQLMPLSVSIWTKSGVIHSPSVKRVLVNVIAGAVLSVSVQPGAKALVTTYDLSGSGRVTACKASDGVDFPPPGTDKCPGIVPGLTFTFDVTFTFNSETNQFLVQPGGSVTLFGSANPRQTTIMLGSPVSSYLSDYFTLASGTSGDLTGLTDPQFLRFPLDDDFLPSIGSSRNYNDIRGEFSTCNSRNCQKNGNQRLNGLVSLDFKILATPAPSIAFALAPLAALLGTARKRYRNHCIDPGLR